MNRTEKVVALLWDFMFYMLLVGFGMWVGENEHHKQMPTRLLLAYALALLAWKWLMRKDQVVKELTP